MAAAMAGGRVGIFILLVIFMNCSVLPSAGDVTSDGPSTEAPTTEAPTTQPPPPPASVTTTITASPAEGDDALAGTQLPSPGEDDASDLVNVTSIPSPTMSSVYTPEVTTVADSYSDQVKLTTASPDNNASDVTVMDSIGNLTSSSSPEVEVNVSAVTEVTEASSTTVTESVMNKQTTGQTDLDMTLSTTQVSTSGSPSAPQNVRLRPVKFSANLTVSWDDPDDSQGIITSYNVSLGSKIWVVPFNGSYEITVDDLTPGTNYTVEVTSEGPHGSSSPATATSSTYPASPHTLTITSRTTHSISLTWVASSAGSFDTFNVYVSKNGIWKNESVSDNTSIVTELNGAGTLYEINVTSVYNGLESESLDGTARTLPPAPSDVSCSTDGKNITFYIVAPTGDFEIEKYVYRYSGSNMTEISSTRSNETFDIAGEPGTTYTASVYTEIDNLKSLSENATCTTELSEPIEVTVSSSSTNTLNVSWQVEGNVDSFTVRCLGVTEDAQDDEQSSFDLRWAECTGLTAGAVYNITVESRLNDSALAVPAVSMPLLSLTNPQPPAVTVDPPLSASNITLSLQYNSSEAQCTHYEIEYSSDGGNVRTETISCNDTRVVLPDLDADSLYGVTVTVISNYSQYNMFSVSENQSTKAWTVPMPVQNLTATEKLARSMYLEWSAPERSNNVHCYQGGVLDAQGACQVGVSLTNGDETCAQLQYRWNCSTTQTGTFTDSSPISFNITGLTPFTNYTVQLAAINPGGASEQEDTLARTDEATPGCVDLTSANITPGFNEISVKFAPPKEPNGVIIQYRVTYWEIEYRNQSMNKTTTTNSVMLDGLLPFRGYNFTVVASTSKGYGNKCDVSQQETATKIGEPYEPTNISGTAESPTRIRVEWGLEEDVETSNITFYNVTVRDMDNNSTQTVTVTGFNNRSVPVNNLRPYRNHSIYVEAYTYNETGGLLLTPGPTPGEARTKATSSGPVAYFNAQSLSADKQCYLIRVTWSPPQEDDIKGNIKQYIVNFTKESGDSNIQTFAREVSVGEIRVDANNKKYTLTVQVENEGQPYGDPTGTLAVVTGLCAPEAPVDGGAALITSPSSPQTTKTSFNVAVDDSFFTNTKNGELTLLGIIVADKEVAVNDDEKSYPSEEDLNNAFPAWSSGVDVAYRASPDDWSPFGAARSDGPVEFTVGVESCSEPNVYCNGPLQAGQSYKVKAVTCTLGGCVVTDYGGQEFATAQPGSNTGAVVGGVIGGLIILSLLLVIGFLLYKRRSSNPSRPVGNGHLTDNCNIPIMEPNGGYSNPGIAIDDEVTRPEPVLLTRFPEHVDKLHRDTDFLFSEEYELVKATSPKHPQTAAEIQENRTKNRYSNILPFDHARVKLLPTDDDDPGSDYINASYMPGYNSKREFIAAQGPMKSTIDDFWRMIWEQTVTMIVMVTKCEERGKEKCAEYWPGDSEPVFFGDLQVTTRSESVLDTYTIRLLDVKLGETCRTIQQFHFLYWPDFGCPENTGLLLNFVSVVRSNIRPSQKGPVVVHCSAGVGRTGTFIAVDRLLQHIEEHDSLDVFATTMEMRNYRPNMIQAEAQYVFVHECMRDVLTMKSKQEEEDDEQENLYQNVKTAALL